MDLTILEDTVLLLEAENSRDREEIPLCGDEVSGGKIVKSCLRFLLWGKKKDRVSPKGLSGPSLRMKQSSAVRASRLAAFSLVVNWLFKTCCGCTDQ